MTDNQHKFGLSGVTDGQAMARKRVAEHDLPLIQAASQRRRDQIRIMTDHIWENAEKDWGEDSKEAKHARQLAYDTFNVVMSSPCDSLPEHIETALDKCELIFEKVRRHQLDWFNLCERMPPFRLIHGWKEDPPHNPNDGYPTVEA